MKENYVLYVGTEYRRINSIFIEWASVVLRCRKIVRTAQFEQCDGFRKECRSALFVLSAHSQGIVSVGISHKQKQLLFLYKKSDILPKKIVIFHFSNKLV
jgi:hypothetical protein